MDESGSPLPDAPEDEDSPQPTTLEDLDMEVQREILIQLPALCLSRARCVCSSWRALTEGIAEELLRRRRRSLLRVAACPCWARCLAVVEIIENAIGPRPAERTWQADNEALRSEAGVDWTYPLPWVLEHAWVKHKVAIGWAERDAQVLAGLADLHGPLGAAFRERSARFAASSHALLDATFAAAMRPERALTSAPARLFANLQGEDGLENLEAIWRPEALLALGIGGSFRTTCLVDAKAPRRCNFRTDDGWYAYIGREAFEGDDAFELQDSDLVCFRASPDGVGGFRSLIHEPRADAEDDIYLLPPLATVCLERIDGEGEWQVELIGDDDDDSTTGESRWPRRRLFTVRVEFGC